MPQPLLYREILAVECCLTTADEIDTWMNAQAIEALKLQRPLPDGALRIFARGGKKDDGIPATPSMDPQPAPPL